VFSLDLKFKNGDNVPDSVGLLISILIRHPEVGTINYDPEMNVLRFMFIMSGKIPISEVKGFKKKLFSCLKSFYYLKNKKVKTVNIKYCSCEDLTLLEVNRDVQTLSSDEISLIIAFLREQFKDYLVCDNNEAIQEEDLMVQEEMIGRMLENIRGTVPQNKVIAFREKGKVLVFNK